MKIRGKLVSRLELEVQLLMVPEIKEVFATQVLENGSEAVVIYAQSDTESEQLALKIFRQIPFLREGISVICLKNLPRTTLGKIDRQQLLALRGAERKGPI